MARPPSPPFQAPHLRLGSRNVQEYGTVDLTGVRDCSYTLNQAYADLVEHDDVEIYHPKGTYRIDQPLLCRDAAPRISGAGARTIFEFDDTDFDWFTYGAGVNTGIVGPSGWIRDIRFESRSKAEAPSGFKAGLKADGAWFVDLSNVWVDYAPIGYDFVNNCFGIHLYRCRTTFGRCRIAERLSGDRPGMVFASGSDINHTDCWLAGRDAAVVFERSGGGYNYFGGQMLSGSGLSAQDTSLGTWLINENLEEVGTVGGRMSVRAYGTSFESASYMPNIRVHDLASNPNGCQLLFSGVSFTGGTQGDCVLRLTDGYNDAISFINCATNGTYTAAVPLIINMHPGAGRAKIFEIGSQSFATFNGSPLDIDTLSMCMVSNLTHAFSVSSFHVQIPWMVLYGAEPPLKYDTTMTNPGGGGWTNV